MGIALDQVILWGRSLDEYIGMFDLRPDDLDLSILDCASGPASFNAEMTRQGGRVISCDPSYIFSPQELARRIEETFPSILSKVEAAQDTYVWREIASPAQLGEVRMTAMRRFLEDFASPKDRYVVASLPNLPFAHQRFDLALCSHFLFTYSTQFSVDFHVASILDMCRVASEVCVFPLLDTTGIPSALLDPVIEELSQRGYHCEIRSVPYEFQRGGNTLLRVT
jgi:hypothetical protein